MTRDVSSQLSEASERYQVPQRLRTVGDSTRRGADAARRGAHAAYRTALDHPKTSIASAIVVAALVGGLLYYLFGDPRRPVERRRKGPRVRARTERRRSHAKSSARTAA